MTMAMYKRQKTRLNENGFASIVIALILLIVLSLLTVAFAQLARREQQTTLDKQLAIQANYAAESGINDTVDELKRYSFVPPANSATQCTNLPHYSDVGSTITTINRSAGISYNCVLVNIRPPTLVRDPLEANKAWNISFGTSGTPNPLDNLTVSWSSIAGRAPHTGPNRFEPQATWRAPAVLHFSITPLMNSDRTSLINNQFTVFMYPSGGGSNIVSYSILPSQQGQIKPGRCDSTGNCSVTINNLRLSPGGTTAGAPYLIHILDYYDNSRVVISAKDVNGSTLHFTDAQALIDVTGKARNVLKRLQVSYPLTEKYTTPNYALEAGDICKRLQTTPGSVGPTGFVNPPTGLLPGNNDPCNFLN